MILRVLPSLLGLLALAYGMKSYDNYKVYKITPSSEEQVQILTDLRKQGYEIWTEIIAVNSDVRVMVAPQKDNEFVQYMESVGIDSELAIKNVQEAIEAQLKPAANVTRNNLGSFSWDRYHTLAEIHDWLDELQELYPNVVTVVNIGTSNEGRLLKGIIIDFKPGERGDNPLTGMIEGGIHSREWISPATVTWIIKEFLTSTDTNVRFMAEAFIWHILPVMNPDGYAYTFTNDRMWRKNRNRANFVTCPIVDDDLSNGIDLNRNFNYLWMSTGASSDPCQQTYAGPTAGSEPETQAVSNYVQALQRSGNVIYYIAFHSYSQMILIPYSHVSGYEVLELENYGDLYEIAARGAAKLSQRHGTQYTVGTSADILYEVSGSSFDWVKGVTNIPIVYLFELRDLGRYGFLLPTEQIIPNNEEVMDCLIEMDRVTRQLRYYSGASSIISSVLLLSTGLIFLFIFKH